MIKAVLGIIATVLMTCSVEAATDRILILQSTEHGHWWGEEEVQGIRRVFAEHPEYELHVETLDLFLFPQKSYRKALLSFMKAKYGPVADQIRGVIVCNSDALQFYVEDLAPFLHSAPFTFSGIREPLPPFLTRSSIPYAGSLQQLGYRETIRTAMRLHPGTKRIVVVTDGSKDVQSNITELKRIAPEFPLEFRFLGGGQTFEETARQLEELKPGDIALRFRLYVDSAGKTMNFEQSLRFIRKHAPVPIYSFWEGLLGMGITGGKLISGVDHGDIAAHLLLGLINHQPGALHHLVRLQTGRYMFDYRELKRFGVDLRLLPPGSIVINQPASFYQTYKRETWALGSTLLMLVSLVATLLWINMKLRATRYDLLRAKKAAEESSLIKSRFLANMSHEIRTPLGAVLGFAELLGASDLPQNQKDDLIGKIKRHGTVLSNLVDDILDLSRAEAGKMPIEKVKVALPELFNDVISTVKFRASDKALKLGVVSKGPIPRSITTDPTRLRQVLTNIIGNAIKFTDNGGVNLTVSFAKRATPSDKHFLVMEVEDTGRGLTEAEARSLFEPFIQADTSTTRKYGGTGLGLALSRDLARALGGNVELTRFAPDSGCTFCISIETGETEGEWEIHSLSDVELSPSSTRRAAAPAPDLKGVRVLLAEDSPDNQAFVSRFLNLAGAEVDLADNGEIAVKKASTNHYDLVLMDIQMPVLDGIAATTQLRSEGFTKPIVALSAHALADQRQRSLEAGCDYHLTKPVNRTALLSTVAKFTRHLESASV